MNASNNFTNKFTIDNQQPPLTLTKAQLINQYAGGGSSSKG